MKPYYDDGKGIVIYHGDCREIVPTLGKFDLVLTDPPYGISGARTGVRKNKTSKGNYVSNFVDDKNYVLNVTIPIIVLCLEKSTRLVVTPGRVNMFDYPRPTHVGSYFYPASCSPSAWGLSLWQPIFFYGKDPFPCKLLPDSKSCNDHDKSNHPCPKPLKSWTWLLSRTSKQDESILDPFAGSGTTAVASKMLGRKCTCVELEERYCEIIVKRCQQDYLQLTDTISHDRMTEKQEEMAYEETDE